MDTTPVYGLPYPTSSDPFDDALMGIPQALAEQLESTLTGFGGIAAPGSWVQVGSGGGAPAFTAGWTTWSDSTNELLAYRKVGTEVTVSGLCRRTSGSSPNIFVLPVGFRPSRITTRFAQVQGTPTTCSIDSAGLLNLTGSLTNGQYVSVWAVFHTDQP